MKTTTTSAALVTTPTVDLSKATPAKGAQVKPADNKTTAREKAKAIAKPAKAAASKPVKADSKTKPIAEVPKVIPFAVPFAIKDYARPGAGRNLFAMTQAWLELSNLYNGAIVSAELLKQVCGNTAITYHTKQLGNFEVTAKGLQLTAKGINFFKARKVENKFDEKVKDAYKAILSTGKMDGVLVKSQSAIAAVKA